MSGKEQFNSEARHHRVGSPGVRVPGDGDPSLENRSPQPSQKSYHPASVDNHTLHTRQCEPGHRARTEQGTKRRNPNQGLALNPDGDYNTLVLSHLKFSLEVCVQRRLPQLLVLFRFLALSAFFFHFFTTGSQVFSSFY